MARHEKRSYKAKYHDALQITEQNDNIVYWNQIYEQVDVNRHTFRAQMAQDAPGILAKIQKILHRRGNNRVLSKNNDSPGKVYLHKWEYCGIILHKIGTSSLGKADRKNQIAATLPGRYVLLGYKNYPTRVEAKINERKLQAEYSDFVDRNAHSLEFFIFYEDGTQEDEILSRDGWIDVRSPKQSKMNFKVQNGSSQASLF